jgi:hypothetical protein
MAPLKLLVEDADDLAIVSAALQDAVLRVGDIQYEPGPRQLTLALNRYRWEAGKPKGERVRTAVQFGGVLKVSSRNLRRDAPDAILSLLAVQFEAGEAPGGSVLLIFSGGGDLRMEVECLDAALSDIGEPWTARAAPVHEED